MNFLNDVVAKRPVRYILALSLLVPALYIFVRLLVTGEDSITLFEDSPVIVPILVLGYYTIVGMLGVAFLLKEIRGYFTLMSEMKKSELSHLQTQVNPHFFFNMLNNLYGLIDKDGPRAKELVLKLSDMMRYSIYDGQRDRVTLSQEVEYMQTYLQLHQMRYHKEVDLRLTTDIADDQLPVLPLMFIILLENAIKHGVEHLRQGSYVHAKLSSDDQRLIFEVTNNFDVEETMSQPGVGLSNLRRRLALVYPDAHELTGHIVGDVYHARLVITDI